jgi:hypothetical protein
VSLDSDVAGAKASWKWWLNHYQHARRWPCIKGKDPGEAYQNGLDIRAWTLAGLNMKDPVIRPFPKEWLTKYNEEELERLAIMTVDAGLLDSEAMQKLGTILT